MPDIDFRITSADYVYLDFDYDKELVNYVKENIPGRKYVKRSKEWKFKLNRNSLPDFLKFLQDWDLDKSDVPRSIQNRMESIIKEAKKVEKQKEKNKRLAEKDEVEDFKVYGLAQGMNPYPFQEVGIKYAVENKNVIIGDEPGLGKAQPLDAKVLTPSGWKEMGEISVGDKVIGSDGKPTTVKGVYPQGEKEVYEVEFSDGSTTEACGEHLWSLQTKTQRSRNKGFNEVKKTEELIDDLRYDYGARKWYIPTLSNPVSYDTKENGSYAIAPYVLGAFIGDGCLLKQHTLFTNKDKQIVAEIRKELPEKGSLNKLKEPTGTEYSLTYGKTPDENIFREELVELGLNEKKAHEKHIPKKYKYGSVKTRVEVLQGLMDTDGTPHGSACQFTSTSKRLAKDLQEIVWSLGGTCKIASRTTSYTHNEEKRTGRKSWRLYFRLPNRFDPFRLDRKLSKLNNPQNRVPTRSIEKIEKVGKKETQCIKVSAEDSLYVTDDYILTHNTVESIAAMHKQDAYPVLVVCPASLKDNWKREWNMWLPRKTAKVQHSSEGLDLRARVCIINYDILWKYRKKLREHDWGGLILDESHYCFPYETTVETEVGEIPIGEVVEENKGNYALSYNMEKQEYSWNKITNRFKNSLDSRKLVKITTNEGKEVTCTENHKVWSIDRNKWVKAKNIYEGEKLQSLRKNIPTKNREPKILFNQLSKPLLQKRKGLHDLSPVRVLYANIRDQKKRKKHSPVLLKKLCSEEKVSLFGNKEEMGGKNVQSSKRENNGRKNVQTLRCSVQISNTRKRSKQKKKVLQSILCSKLENEPTETPENIQESPKKGTKSFKLQQTRCGKKNEETESRPQVQKESEESIPEVVKRKSDMAPFKRGKWKINRTSDEIGESSWFRRVYRAPHINQSGERQVQGFAQPLFGRHSISEEKAGNRGRRRITQDEKMEVSRSKERKSFKCVRVDRVEILERGSQSKHKEMYSENPSVYDIEVENNHNYHANSILVHNCKNGSAKRSKAARQIARRIDGPKVLLSGTAVVNRPKELINQLKIIDRFEEEFGGFYPFVKRYCLPESAPVLMSDFSEKNVSDISIGDKVIGWKKRESGHSQLVESEVLKTFKRKADIQKTIMENGDVLYHTPDHKWANGSKIKNGGDGPFWVEAKAERERENTWRASQLAKVYRSEKEDYFENKDYMKGYLCGAFRGDGWLSRTRHTKESPWREKKSRGDYYEHSCGIATQDKKTIQRCFDYLNSLSLTSNTMSQRSDDLWKIECSNKSHWNFFQSKAHKRNEDKHWYAGFLAGIYDTEATGLVISQCSEYNKSTYNLIQSALDFFGFNYNKYEDKITVTGGRSALFKLWKISNPALQRKLKRYVLNAGGRFVSSKQKVTHTEIVEENADVYTIKTETGNYVAYGYCSRNCDAEQTRWGLDYDGASNVKELHERLKKLCYIRRNKKEVLEDLPDKQRSYIEFDIDNRKEYNMAEEDLAAHLRKQEITDEDFLEEIESLDSFEQQKKIRKEYGANEVSGYAEKLMKLAELRKLASKGKLKKAKSWIKDFLKSGEKLVLFAHHKFVIQELVDEFDALKIDGSVPVEDRQDVVDKFQNDDSEKVIVLNIQAGGTGLTLTESSNVVFLELPWTPAEVSQAEDRCHRIGQEDSVNVYFLLAKETIDRDMFEVLKKKRIVTEQINAGKDITDEEGNVVKGVIKKITDRQS